MLNGKNTRARYDTMKVSLVGHFSDALDEGMRNVSRSLADELIRNGIESKTFTISSLGDWRAIRDFGPDVIHFFLTPTSRGVIVAKLMSKLCPSAKTVLSAIHPSLQARRLLKPFSPDLVLVQTGRSDALFKSLGFSTRFFPNGVDLRKFKPISAPESKLLRDRYHVPTDDFVILHVASMKRARNLDVFKTIQREEGNQVIIVAREREAGDAGDKRLLRELRQAGCLVWQKHFPHLEDVYNLSDCYVFPTIERRACIETPLSVLEAMACNLPVITTRFGGLPEAFPDGPGLVFAERVEQIPDLLSTVRNARPAADTRRLVSRLSWDLLGADLIRIYEGLVY